MIGVVIWRDRNEGKAVIWCEDQGDLAYYGGTEAEPTPLDVGDVVQFDLELSRNIRTASHVSVLAENWRSGIENVLTAIGDEPSGAQAGAGAEIIPFRFVITEEEDERAVGQSTRRHG